MLIGEDADAGVGLRLRTGLGSGREGRQLGIRG